MTKSRLLYLGFAFPPGVQALYPHLNPAGHRFEVQMLVELSKQFELRTVGVLPFDVRSIPANADPSSGVHHELVLDDRPPAMIHRYLSLLRLVRQYAVWTRSGWQPEAVLSYNLSPIYNSFVRGLWRKRDRPKLILLLLDSAQLGTVLPWRKKLRYRFKPLVVPDAQMLPCFDGCIGLSPNTEQYFTPRAVPFLWMPGACSSERWPSPGASSVPIPTADEPIRFGYFGALAAHAGIVEFARIFLESSVPATLQICGYGRLSGVLSDLANANPRLQFKGLLPKPEDCLGFGQSCDILVNPRPSTHGNENNFPSKIFEYSLCGRAILTTRLSGVDLVLGEQGTYFDAHDFRTSLLEVLPCLASTPRQELHRRGQALLEKVGAEFTWGRQGSRMSEFIKAVCQ